MPTNDLLTRAVAKVIPQKLAEEKLRSGKELRVYLGIDPTSSKLHLGHAIALRKLGQFAAAGHHAILLIGSFTATLGDPSGRDELRKPLTKEQVEKNFQTYRAQAAKVIDMEKIETVYNHTWLEKLSQHDLISLASHFTKQQMEQRDMFQRREREGNPIHMHEFLYPLYQGYDSVHLDVDCEIGATDQEFNMLCGRTLQKAFGKREKFIITTRILEGTDGRKMSKTYGNCIDLEDPPGEMFGKVMSIRDDLMATYFECCTDIPVGEYQKLLKGNPKEAKIRLARAIVALYHCTKAADRAEKEFTRVFSKGETPKDIPEFRVEKGTLLVDALVASGLVSSKSEARRLIEQKGIELNKKVIQNANAEVEKGIVQIGKRRFLRLTITAR